MLVRKCQDEISNGKERKSKKHKACGGGGRREEKENETEGRWSVCRSNEAEGKVKKSGKAPTQNLGPPRTWRREGVQENLPLAEWIGGRLVGKAQPKSNRPGAIVASVNWKYPGLGLLEVWVTVGACRGLFFAQLELWITTSFGLVSLLSRYKMNGSAFCIYIRR